MDTIYLSMFKNSSDKIERVPRYLVRSDWIAAIAVHAFFFFYRAAKRERRGVEHTTLVVALVNPWTTAGLFPSHRSRVPLTSSLERARGSVDRGAREDGITRGARSIGRRTGESRRELDIAHSGPGLTAHMSPLSCRSAMTFETFPPIESGRLKHF